MANDWQLKLGFSPHFVWQTTKGKIAQTWFMIASEKRSARRPLDIQLKLLSTVRFHASVAKDRHGNSNRHQHQVDHRFPVLWFICTIPAVGQFQPVHPVCFGFMTRPGHSVRICETKSNSCLTSGDIARGARVQHLPESQDETRSSRHFAIPRSQRSSMCARSLP